MTCETCGEKPKKCGDCNKDFPRAVIEINNPETLVLLRKVVIPASMGDDTTVPPTIGKYRNVLLSYEANNRLYLYSSDGIPTLLETSIPESVLDRISTLEDEVDTMAEYSAYSTSETDSGEKWIDGKTIYKKTVDFGALPNNTTQSVNHGISGISRIIKMEGYAYCPQFTLFSSLSDTTIGLKATDEQVEITTTLNWSQFTECYVTLYYTKTA